MATTEQPPDGEDATSGAPHIPAQDRRELTRTAITPSLRHPRWRTQRTRDLMRLASEADMFVWEKIRLRDLRDDLDAESTRRQARERLAHALEAASGTEGELALVDFERDSWPH
jgi:hypothetical protein